MADPNNNWNMRNVATTTAIAVTFYFLWSAFPIYDHKRRKFSPNRVGHTSICDIGSTSYRLSTFATSNSTGDKNSSVFVNRTDRVADLQSARMSCRKSVDPNSLERIDLKLCTAVTASIREEQQFVSFPLKLTRGGVDYLEKVRNKSVGAPSGLVTPGTQLSEAIFAEPFRLPESVMYQEILEKKSCN